MSKEELEKEAKTECFMLTVNTIGIDQRDVELAYIMGAEPREKRIAELEEKLAGAERTRDNLIQLGFPTFQSCKEYADKMNYAKTIIKDLLDNSDEYARQRAEEFLRGDKDNG